MILNKNQQGDTMDKKMKELREYAENTVKAYNAQISEYESKINRYGAEREVAKSAKLAIVDIVNRMDMLEKGIAVSND